MSLDINDEGAYEFLQNMSEVSQEGFDKKEDAEFWRLRNTYKEDRDYFWHQRVGIAFEVFMDSREPKPNYDEENFKELQKRRCSNWQEN